MSLVEAWSLQSRVPEFAFAAFVIAFLVVGARAPSAIGTFLAASIPVWALVLLAYAASSTVEIGTDGVTIAWLGRRQFVRFADVEHVGQLSWGSATATTTWGVELVLRRGGRKNIVIGTGMAERPRAIAVFREIRDAWRRYDMQGHTASDAGRLARRGREPEQWLASLRSIGSGAHVDMRSADEDAT